MGRKRRYYWWWVLFLLLGCERPSIDPTPPTINIASNVVPTPTLSGMSVSSPTSTPVLIPTTTPFPSPTVTATPFFRGIASPACGQRLPIVMADVVTPATTLDLDPVALAQFREAMPAAAQPAWDRILAAPETVGLVAYQVGDEANGVYLNPDMPMPLASVVKLIHLIAYVEAVADGTLTANTPVTLERLEQTYLPNFDLGAHRRAIEELGEAGDILNPDSETPAVLLSDIPWMMIRHSSNAASDYLHMLLGQVVIEETALLLDLPSQTAPCPFLGQFLAMGNHTRVTNDQFAITAYQNDITRYAEEVMLLTDAYIADERFRQAEIAWRNQWRRPSFRNQDLFTHRLSPQGSARDYAQLMARLAQNGLSNSESSYQARRYLEWPMRFPENQLVFDNLGLKNGSLPGVRTTVYYAYRQGERVPVVVALFYHDLPNNVYRRWRNTFPDDELARWLLADPNAIFNLSTLLP